MCLSMISLFCILLSGIIHSTSLLFGVFLIEPSRWAKHKRTARVFKGYFSASSKLISWLALIDSDNKFSNDISGRINFFYFVIFFQSNFIFDGLKWSYFISFNWLMKWYIFIKDSLLRKFMCLNCSFISII